MSPRQGGRIEARAAENRTKSDGPADIPLDYKQPASPTGRRPNHNKWLVVGAILLALLVPALILTSVCSSIPAQIHRMHCQSSMRQIGYALLKRIKSGARPVRYSTTQASSR